jgi:hypothetical protein
MTAILVWSSDAQAEADIRVMLKKEEFEKKPE